MRNCKECDAILRDYRIAYAQFWERASQQTREAYTALREIVDGSAADLENAVSRLEAFRPMDAGRLRLATLQRGASYMAGEEPMIDVMLKKWRHQIATGHVVTISSGSF